MRKTVDVERIKELHNKMNAASIEGTGMYDARSAITLFAETLLSEVDQYRGFRYTSKADASRKHLY